MASQGCIFFDKINGVKCGKDRYKDNSLCEEHYKAQFKDSNNESKSDDESTRVKYREKAGSMTKENSIIFLDKKQVTFKCYIILDNDSIISAGDATDDTSGGSSNDAKNHPDQKFFNRQLSIKVVKALLGHKIKKIITDCSAYPCKECFVALPPLIRTYFSLKGGEKIPIIMYGHKIESGKGLPCMCTTDTDSEGSYFADVWSWK